ncbi:hypothetical protein [Persicobacter psychrovividus]|uniref:Uncharacterized protein n=1 Tax=Persicobacter psychrovividus TaxID=387638 RepID=A0ABM7VFW4_9BACT|nr:hypothetical protein PEPS_21250 [Persicobacter psychrovividus]
MFTKDRLTFKTSRDYINKVNMMMYILLALPLIIFVMAYLKSQGNQFAGIVHLSASATAILRAANLLVVVISIAMGYKGYAKIRNEAKPIEDLREKLMVFYGALQQKIYWIAIGYWMSSICAFVTGDKFYFAMFCITLIVFSWNNPTLHKVAKDLDLNKQEGWQVLKGEEI